MKKIYLDKDIDMEVLKGKKIAIIGYGSQGHAHALNLKESGMDVCVGLKEGSKSIKKAQDAGLEVYTVSEAAKKSQIIMMLVPDEIMGNIFYSEVAPNLEKTDYLAFAHGFNVHYNQIIPPAGVEIFMVAPKSPGHLVRRQYTEGKGVPALYASLNENEQTEKIAMAYAKAIGSGRTGIMDTTFKEEVETDLFGEQAVLCGGVVELMKVGFEVLVEAGYSKEGAYFECVNEMKLIVDLIFERGIKGMNESISNTAEYGEYKIGPRIITNETKNEMKKVLAEIKNGEFAKDFLLENQVNNPIITANRKMYEEHDVEITGNKLRKMMKM